MCQFAKLYPVEVLEELIKADEELKNPTVEKILATTDTLNDLQFAQEPTAQIQQTYLQEDTIGQELPAQIEDVGNVLAAITHYPVSQIENYFVCSINALSILNKLIKMTGFHRFEILTRLFDIKVQNSKAMVHRDQVVSLWD